TQFHIRLPAAPQGMRASSLPPRSIRDEKIKLLVIDDESILLEMIRRKLSKDFDVTTTTHAEEALSWLEDGFKFDVILCDITMPGMTGPQFYDAVGELDVELR